MSYKTIGNTLTDAEFNGLISILSHFKTLRDNIKINNTVTGNYGGYDFNITGATIVDNGILISDETLTSIGTVTLTNPVFKFATYKLYLTVYSYDDVNIMNDETTADPTITTLEIELIKDTPVNIPFNTLNKNCIVSFDAYIDIKQDKPVTYLEFDPCTTHDPNEWIKGDAITVTTNNNGTTLSIINATTTTYFNIYKKELTGNFGITIYTTNQNSDTSASKTRIGITDGSVRGYFASPGNVYFNLTRIDGVYTCRKSSDGETWEDLTASGTFPTNDAVNLFIGMYNNSNIGKTLTYKDLKIYRIK